MKISENYNEVLRSYLETLKKWNKKINLISDSTVDQAWERHVMDSAQLLGLLNPEDVVFDLGTGAGFPGMVLSILGVKTVVLIESDIRKGVFLRNVSKLSENKVLILNDRIEEIDFSTVPLPTKIVSRALASVSRIFDYCDIICALKCKILLLKGKNYEKELEEAKKTWHFELITHKSLTNTESVVLEISNVRKKNKDNCNS